MPSKEAMVAWAYMTALTQGEVRRLHDCRFRGRDG